MINSVNNRIENCIVKMNEKSHVGYFLNTCHLVVQLPSLRPAVAIQSYLILAAQQQSLQEKG